MTIYLQKKLVDNAPPMIPRPFHLLSVTLLMIACLASGCLHMEQAVVLHSDGRVNISIHYSVPDEYFAALAEGRAQIDALQDRSANKIPCWPWNRRAVKEFLEAGGGELEEYSTELKDGRRHVQVEYTGSREDLARSGAGILPLVVSETGKPGVKKVKLQLTATCDGPREESPVSGGKLPPLLENLKWRFALTVPGEIESTTGQRKAANMAEWVFDGSRDSGAGGHIPEISLTYTVKQESDD